MDTTDSPAVITERLLQQLKACGKRFKVADSTGVKLSGIDLLTRTLALRSYLMREVFEPDEKYVGVFLPPTVPAAATNFAIALSDRVSVNLNYTASSETLKQCAETAGLKHVITSRRFLDKVGLDVGCPTILLEDVREKITIGDKLFAFLNARVRSPRGLHSNLGLSHKRDQDPLTVIFTSGSTGVPKGVVLSCGNISSNVDGIGGVINLGADDVILGVLPFFHSFGFTVALWTAMVLPCAAAYHFSPLEARPIGKLAEDFGTTVLLATPTFLRAYIRRVEPHQFQKLDVVVVGAEKMPLSLAEEFQQRFGVRPVEGYGTTELSPVVSVNIPPSRDSKGNRLREGSVGQPLPDIEARVVSVDTDEPLPSGETGLLEIRGPNVMQGYLNRPDLTTEVMHDGWYRTGDVGIVDRDNFIHITGRLSRFSKIGGEMVPHIQIEDVMNRIVGIDEEGALRVGITAVPDIKRGERLVVLHTPLQMSKSDILKQMTASGLPNLYLPDEEAFVEVEAIPVLGSGKLDLKGMQSLAAERMGSK
jgi:acyl-[acyl-carrier-protein]-phospholipid O-acyltransferase / long-chain-fatty-acid--[acyl-carrier-protein] ligase